MDTHALSPLSGRLGEGAVDLSLFFRIAQGLCSAIADLHTRNRIHGRINPVDVLTSADGRRVELRSVEDVWAPRPERVAPAHADGDETAYISPEQTGRINRSLDHRTDFYSLGATLYALLTGGPPFRSADRLEIIHSHLARTPASPSTIDARVPEQVSRIVMRLLAKAAEDRYQSASGVRHDLAECAREWSAGGSIPLFPLGTQDVSDRLLIPQRLFGRQGELQALAKTFETVCEGASAVVLVAGYSGVGKTSLINELYKPIVRQRGHFVAGKFDQVVRNIPYGAVIQAFRSLVWQLLTESEEHLGEWRQRLLETLGPHAGVLADVIPEIEFVIGKQPAPPALDPAEAQNRFRYVFESFLGVVAREDHPLVVFLDDLQWVDAATLDLLHALVTSPALGHVMFIGAYRENEVDAGHLLTWAIRRLQGSGALVHTLSLGPLALPEIVAFLCEALHLRETDVSRLAELILEKTAGNPFFVIQFLKTLHHEGLLRFDPARGAWAFQTDAIAAAGMTDNVIDLMTRKIRRLSAGAQRVVTLAACIGNPFDWPTFLTAGRVNEEDAAAGLQEALEAGLIEPQRAEAADSRPATAPAYAFLHDRVQQAAYELIPADQRTRVHLEVGRLLLAECGREVPDDRLFEIVNHLNIGSGRLTDVDERLTLARLNLAAGRKAKTSAAYLAACASFEQGIALLDEEHWQAEYDLMFALHFDAAECQYLAGRFDKAEDYFTLLLARARTRLQKAQVHSLRIVLYENLSRYKDALFSAAEALALFGMSLPAERGDIEAALEDEIAQIDRLRGARSIGTLLDLPPANDADVTMLTRVLTLTWSAAYITGDQALARLISATIVRLTLQHGVTDDSPYGYVTHAITIGPVRRDYAAAYEWGVLALNVNERLGGARYRAKIQQQFHAHVKLWRDPFAACIAHAREARRSGLESGDFNYAGYGTVTEAWPALMISRDLDQFVREFAPASTLLERIRMEDFRAALQVLLNWAGALQGRTSSPLSLTDAQFDEAAFIARYRADAPFFLTFLYTARLHLCVLHEHFDEAVRLARLAREVTVVGTMWPVLLDFWGSLAMTGAWSTADENTRRQYRNDLMTAEAALKELADNCPQNFRCFALLVSAEMAHISDRCDEAAELCEQAIAYARQTDNLQQEAIANELAAKARLAVHGENRAASHIEEARRCYGAWGALAKVRQLDARYGQLLRQPAVPQDAVPAATLQASGESLDMATVLKVARAVAVEIELRNLLPQLMRLALENAGATRALFIRDGPGVTVVEAEATVDDPHVRVGVEAAAAGERVAQSVVRYVRRTAHDVVVRDAVADERFAADPYVASVRAKSILCVPVVHQGRTGGILYLENSLTADAFTPSRTEMMRILAAQAAVSLENARLYEGMKEEVERRTRAEQSLRDALAEVEALKNRLEAENVYLQEEIRTQHNFNEIVGNSPALVEALRSVELVAPTESTVLILGETGSGKELFARAVHNRSQRASRPLVKVNCGAIAPGLVESELFGHVKGAFTGAIEKRVGRFEVANGGTILLDEIGELPLDAQVKLLRVLQEQELEPVGSSRTVRVDVRVIAATNRDLEQAAREGKFRPDLLYRLNVFPIRIPPLRERKSDVPLLVSLFVSGLARRLGKPLQGFSARSMERLIAYSWPGNVRELQNVVERAAILARGPVIEVDGAFSAAATPAADRTPAAGETLDEIQRAHIRAVLKMTDGVVEGTRGAATILGIHPNTLRSRMRKLGITPTRLDS